MYPVYWTTSKRGIFMRYSYEFKKDCVELYRQGKWMETPEGIGDKKFHDAIRNWYRLEESNGTEVLKHKNLNNMWEPEEKLKLVNEVLVGNSIKSVAIKNGINEGMLYSWVRKYREMGYNGLVSKKKGRPPKEPNMKKNANKPRKLEESELEELIRLKAEIAYLKAENEIIKKEIALREEREAARLKAKKQRLSKNSEKKGTS